MVVLCVLFGRRITTLKEFLNSPFTFHIHWTLWIHSCHLRDFVVCHYRQMTDEVHQLPAVLVRVVVGCCPECRHTRESNTVLDDVIQLTVAELLCRGLC